MWIVWPSKISWPPIILKWGSCWPPTSSSCRKPCNRQDRERERETCLFQECVFSSNHLCTSQFSAAIVIFSNTEGSTVCGILKQTSTIIKRLFHVQNLRNRCQKQNEEERQKQTKSFQKSCCFSLLCRKVYLIFIQVYY